MKKQLFVFFISLILLCSLCACSASAPSGASAASLRPVDAAYEVSADENGVLRDYSYDGNGTWSCDGNDYSYMLTLSGTMPRAAKMSVFVVLSTTDEVTFTDAYRSVVSSNSEDFFDPAQSVIVEMY